MRWGLVLGLGVGCVVGVGACSSKGDDGGGGAPNPPPTDPAALVRTLGDLAAFGEKRVGTVAGAAAGDYVSKRFADAGLAVAFEPFDFPRYDVDASASSVIVTVDGAASNPGFDVFEASGVGHADADVVYVGTAQPNEVAGVDLTGKIALVERNRFYHRSSQVANVVGKGAVAMLYVSAAPDNLRQVGSVRRTWETMVAVPCVTIGANDGAALVDAAKNGKALHATIDVAAKTTPAVGRNVVARIEGDDPDGRTIVVGAHYDTWFTGSTDNGSGVAAVLAIAERRAARWKSSGKKPAQTLVFVAYDGEEVALFGGYDFMRKHGADSKAPITAVLNLEIPSAKGGGTHGIGHSVIEGLDDALRDAELDRLYPLYVNMSVVPGLFGGIIPTDIQGIYRSGVPTATTAVDSPYYHTTGDTPDKVDETFLADAVDRFDRVIDTLLAAGPSCCAGPDAELWHADVALRPRADATAPLDVDVTVTDATGAPQAGAPIDGALLYDDFFPAGRASATTDAAGRATLELASDAANAGAGAGAGKRWLHVTARKDFPLVERVVAVP